MNCEWLFENENPEGRAGVVLKAPRRGFVLATTSFIWGYGSWVSVAAINRRGRGSAACAVWVVFIKSEAQIKMGRHVHLIPAVVTPVTCVPGAGCESGHVRLTMDIVGRDCALPLAGSTSPDFDCRGFFTRAIAR